MSDTMRLPLVQDWGTTGWLPKVEDEAAVLEPMLPQLSDADIETMADAYRAVIESADQSTLAGVMALESAEECAALVDNELGVRRFGPGVIALARGERRALQVIESDNGHYIGTVDADDLPVSRESEETWPDPEDAIDCLETGRWTQRPVPFSLHDEHDPGRTTLAGEGDDMIGDAGKPAAAGIAPSAGA